jgi:two-component system, sensor histidine kinase and response regulator
MPIADALTLTANILIAEDSPTQAERLRCTLEQNNYQVTSAPNGVQALGLARKQKPALVISDIVMPEMDGYELCRQIKNDSRLKNVPVILLTTLSDPQDVIRGLESRADNFIIKPYDEKCLLSRIQFVLRNCGPRACDHAGNGVEIYFHDERHVITADRPQILGLLLSTYEAAIQRNQELSRNKEELRTANAALESANKELEAFSYSVSHDLRAPLRAIDGFSQSIIDDCADKLDANGQELLSRVRNACKRMGQLIDDLLNLSRITRAEMHYERVDLTAIATAILGEMQRDHPERPMTVHVAQGLIAKGDPRLLRIVLENLLGNAWKFTTKRSDATIEFAAMSDNDEKIFIVRDNGAGFDMAYATKLFGAFQRLHSSTDFPGTGIGLATVQRIIHRHGGRIWPESAVGAGTTFHFTLG